MDLAALPGTKEWIAAHPVCKSFRVIYMNTPAIKKNKRYIDVDLNRCFPGKKNGSSEERLAYEALPYLQNTPYNYDFHSTAFDAEPYGVISVYNAHIKKVIRRTGVNNYVVTDLRCLVRFAQNGLAFEMGNDARPQTARNTFGLMKRILAYHGVISEQAKKTPSTVRLFQVYGALNKKDYRSMEKSIQDFKRVKEDDKLGVSLDGETVKSQIDFYPMWRNHPDMINVARRIEIKD